MAKAEVSALSDDTRSVDDEEKRDTVAGTSWLDWEPRTLRGCAALLLLPLAVRAIVAFELSSNPLDSVPIIDAQHYDEVAKSIVDGTFTMSGPFWQPPLYEFFLAGIYAIFGHSLGAVRAVQALLGSVSCVLVFSITRRLFGTRSAWFAYAIASFYGTLVLHDFELMPPTLLVFLQLLLVWGCIREPRRRRGAFGWGALFGCAVITIPNVLISAPLFAWYAARRNEAPRKELAQRATAWALGAALVIAPVTLANYTTSGELVLVSYNNGINFFIGNNPDYDKTFGIRPGYHWKQLDMLPSIEGNAVSPRERSAFYVHKSTAWLSSEPKAFARLVAKKAALLVSGSEIPRNQEIYPLGDDSWLLGVLLWSHGLAFPFGLMLPLAVVGIALSARSCEDARLRRLILAHAALYALSIVAFFVTARHRLPLVALLLPFAGFAVHRLWQGARQGLRMPFFAATAGFVALVWACNAWNVEPKAQFGSGTLTELAFHFWQAGDTQRGEELLERAVRIDPQNVDAALALAERVAAAGRPEEALAIVAALAPVFPALDLTSLAPAGQTRAAATLHAQQALAELQPVAQLWPEQADAQLKWSERLASEGAVGEAKLHRGSAAALYAQIGQSYLRAGRIDWAASNLAKAIALNPTSVPAMNGVGIVYASRGEWAKAVELWLGVLKLDPSNAEAKALLAKARPAFELAKQPH